MSRVLRPSRHFISKWSITTSATSTPTFANQCRSMTTTTNSANVAFVGLGNMGLQMALNLARNKPTDIHIQHLTVHDINQADMDTFVKMANDEGLHDTMDYSQSSTLAKVLQSNPDYILTSLPTCEASESVVETILQDGSMNKHPSILIDTSTISVSTSRKLHEQIKASSLGEYIDAPVSGGVKGATDATLTFMVGSPSPTTTKSIEPILHKMGSSVIPCGGPGSGTAVKLCNNAALAAQMVGICEAMNLGTSLGVDPTVLAGVMNVSTAKCWSSCVNNPHPVVARSLGSGASAHGYEGGFGSGLMLKDLNLAMDEAGGVGLNMPVSALTRRLYEKVDADGYGGKDFGIMLKYLKEMEMSDRDV